MLEEEARTKRCPFKLALTTPGTLDAGLINCEAGDCMAWAWWGAMYAAGQVGKSDAEKPEREGNVVSIGNEPIPEAPPEPELLDPPQGACCMIEMRFQQ